MNLTFVSFSFRGKLFYRIKFPSVCAVCPRILVPILYNKILYKIGQYSILVRLSSVAPGRMSNEPKGPETLMFLRIILSVALSARCVAIGSSQQYCHTFFMSFYILIPDTILSISGRKKYLCKINFL